jgi:hypothetical protein
MPLLIHLNTTSVIKTYSYIDNFRTSTVLSPHEYYLFMLIKYCKGACYLETFNLMSKWEVRCVNRNDGVGYSAISGFIIPGI